MAAISSLVFTVLVWAAVALVLVVFLYEVYVLIGESGLRSSGPS